MDRLIWLNLADQGLALLIAFLLSLILCLAAQASLIPHNLLILNVL
jgi:hypothetical protein